MTEDIIDGLDSTCKCLENRLNKGFPQLIQTKRKQDIEHVFSLLSGRSGVRVTSRTLTFQRNFISRSASILAKRTSAFFVPEAGMPKTWLKILAEIDGLSNIYPCFAKRPIRTDFQLNGA